jgi:hypothetical protein
MLLLLLLLLSERLECRSTARIQHQPIVTLTGREQENRQSRILVGKLRAEFAMQEEELRRRE